MRDQTTPVGAALDPLDLFRLRRAIDLAGTVDVTKLLQTALGATPPRRVADVLVATTAVDHAAVLVVPPSLDDLARAMREAGVRPAPPIRSVVVAERLSARFGPLDVWILRGELPCGDRQVEVFAPVPKPGCSLPTSLAGSERRENHEAHLALRLSAPDGGGLESTCEVLLRRTGLAAAGGGYNPNHGPFGVTVLYFARASTVADVPAADWCRRLEITCGGHRRDAIQAHLRAGSAEAR
jgi:hypothetical protein